jgi:hypothetical protein
MLGRGLIRRLTATAVVAGAALVAIVALGATTYHLLTMVLPLAGAAAVTALIFAVIAGGVSLLFLGKARGEDSDEEPDDEPVGLGARAYDLFRQRPLLGTVAALAGGFIFLRNPALATMVAAAFTEKARPRTRHR